MSLVEGDFVPGVGGGEADATLRPDPFVALALVNEGLDLLQAADVESLDRDWFIRFTQSVNETMARLDAVSIDAAAEVTRRGHDADLGYFTTAAWLTHFDGLPSVEARARMQVLRLFELLPGWAHAARRGEVLVPQTRLMARAAANPRIHDALVEHWEMLLEDAILQSYEKFETLLRNFARSADTDGAKRSAERAQDRRDVTMRQRPDGSWKLRGTFGSLQGAELNEYLAHFGEAQWHSDWAEARERLDTDDVSIADLRRTEPQRRADAFASAILAGARAPARGRGPLPTLNVLIDEATLEATLTRAPLDPGRYRQMVCRTQGGDQIDVSEAAAMTWWACVRGAVHNGARVVTELGRRERLYKRGAREAVMLLETCCVWPGCNRPVRACQADHSIAWKAHGATVPRNGGPMCPRHNRLKDRGDFTARRLDDGEWLFLDADFNPIA